MKCAVFVLLAWVSLSAFAQNMEELEKQTPAQLERGIENEHPVTHYVLAARLFESGQKDKAVFWFYAGQLRYRFHLAANPNLPPDGDGALFGALSSSLGQPINEYAFGDLDALRATLDNVLAWDAKTKNGFTSKEKHAKVLGEIRGGLTEMIAYVEKNRETIRKQRAANGLENRD